MSVHNSEHNSPHNSDHDDDIHDSVTRIKGKNKIGFIDGSCKRSNTDEVLGKQWDRVNAIVLGWILNSISEELFLGQIFSKRAKYVWEELKETYDKVDGSIIFGLHNQINTLKQNGSSIADYYHKLNALWKQFDAMIELPKCVCNASESFKNHNQLMKLMQFLMGLDDSYMKIRSSILSREVLPDVRSAYATISSEESHRVAVGSIAGSSQRNQASAFVSNVPNSQNFQRSNQNFNIVPSRTYRIIIDQCFKIIGYPADFGKKKSGQNFKKQGVSNNNSIGKSSSSGFLDEQMATLLSLIKENKIRKNVQANMAVLILIKIKVGHPNGTEAFISKIGNLQLSNGLTLYDVMDLNLKNVQGTSDQCEGLLGYPAEHRAKQTREPFPLSDHVSSSLGELVHLDLWGPYRVTSSEGFKYFLTIMDDYTRAIWVYLIKSKDEVSPFITVFYNLIENQFNKKIKVFRSDNGTEFVNQYVNKFCADKGVIHQTCCAYTPQQNGIAERKHRHLLNVARSLMFQGGIPLRMWSECILTATYLINRLPSSMLNGKSPYEMIYRKCPSLSHLRFFGCLCFATLINSSDKFGSRSKKWVLIGYSSVKKGYRLYSLDKHQFIFSRDVKFFENIFPFKDSNKIKDATENVFQDVNHIKKIDIEYPEIPNDDERVDPNLNSDINKA
ncbi:ribonuclease H-like domain-containing protein [Tanacetum coccineum]